jgi:hypothetical protein
MIDIDIYRNGRYTHLLHWYQSDLALVETTSELVPTCSTRKRAAYGGPSPPPSSTHRYVELVFKQPIEYKFPVDFEPYLEPSIPARLFFNITDFVKAANIGDPVAANYFTVSGSQGEQDNMEL